MDFLPAEIEISLPHMNTSIKVRHFENQPAFMTFIQPLEQRRVPYIPQYMNSWTLAYLLDSGWIAANFKGECNIFYSAGDLDKYLVEKMYADTSLPKHYLFGKNPYGNEFPSHAARLSDNFKKLLGLENEKTSETILKLMSAKISETSKPRKLKGDHLLDLVALVGEAYKNDHPHESIQWIAMLANDKITWVPELESCKGSSEITWTLYDFLLNGREHRGEDPLEMTYVMISTRI